MDNLGGGGGGTKSTLAVVVAALKFGVICMLKIVNMMISSSVLSFFFFFFSSSPLLLSPSPPPLVVRSDLVRLAILSLQKAYNPDRLPSDLVLPSLSLSLSTLSSLHLFLPRSPLVFSSAVSAPPTHPDHVDLQWQCAL